MELETLGKYWRGETNKKSLSLAISIGKFTVSALAMGVFCKNVFTKRPHRPAVLGALIALPFTTNFLILLPREFGMGEYDNDLNPTHPLLRRVYKPLETLTKRSSEVGLISIWCGLVVGAQAASLMQIGRQCRLGKISTGILGVVHLPYLLGAFADAKFGSRE